MAPHVSCPNRTCPNVTRLQAAIACYREQQALIAQLQDENTHFRERLARYIRIGLRRWSHTETQAKAQALYGSQVWSENVLLRHAVQALHARLQHKTSVSTTLKALLQTGEAQTNSQEVA